jgi:hypothetical protein
MTRWGGGTVGFILNRGKGGWGFKETGAWDCVGFGFPPFYYLFLFFSSGDCGGRFLTEMYFFLFIIQILCLILLHVFSVPFQPWCCLGFMQQRRSNMKVFLNFFKKIYIQNSTFELYRFNI